MASKVVNWVLKCDTYPARLDMRLEKTAKICFHKEFLDIACLFEFTTKNA